MADPVRWPAQSYDPEGADVAAPVQQLLRALRLLENEDEGDTVTLAGTPSSKQVVTAGATTMSKWWTWLVGAAGGVPALVGGITGWYKVFADDVQSAVVGAALLVASAIIGSAVAIAIALIVRADVRARADATAARFRARGALASAAVSSLVAPPGGGTPYGLLDAAGSWHRVQDFRWVDGSAVAVVDGDKLPAREWKGLIRLDEALGH